MKMRFVWISEKHFSEGHLDVESDTKEKCLNTASELLETVTLVNWYEI